MAELEASQSPLDNPYVGPRTFEEKDGRFFFGREREARELLSQVISEPLVLFYAQSGAGKSSLINTRLRPGLRQEGFTILPIGRVSGQLPTDISQVDNIYIFNLLLSLDQSQAAAERLTQTSLTEYLQTHKIAPATTAESDDDDANARVLIIDQFEEIVTTHLDHWPERQDFFRQLRQAIKDDPLLWVVLTLREDFVAALDSYAKLLPGKLRARFHMQRMSYQAASQAIEQPARQAGRPFAPGVAQTLVDNLRQLRTMSPQTETQLGQFVVPVQLQVVCYQLWENLKNREPGEITQQDLQEFGDVDTTLAQYYEQALAETIAQTDVSEIELRRWFEDQLITEAGTRGNVYRGRLQTGGMPNEAVDFLTGRFLLRAEARTGGTWYELIHDRFVEPILLANRNWRLEQPLIQLARAWADSDRSETHLLEGQPLQEALSSDWQGLGPLVAEFLEAGQAAQQARNEALRAEKELQRQRELEQQRVLANEQRLRAEEQAQAATSLRKRAVWLAVAGGIAVVLAILAGVFGIRASQSAQAAKDAEEIAVTNKELAEREATAAVIARETAVANEQRAEAGERNALAAQATAEAEQAAAEQARAEAEAAKAETERLSRIIRADQLAARAVNVIETHPQRSSLLVLEALKMTLDEGDSQSSLVEQSFRDIMQAIGGRSLVIHESDVVAISFSPDGRWLASGSHDGTARLSDVTDPAAEPVVLRGHEASILAIAFSPDGRWLASASADRTARLWDVSTLPGTSRSEQQAGPVVLRGHEDLLRAVTFSPDGRWLATASDDRTIRLWNMNNLEAAPIVLRGHKNFVRAVVFSPDGRWLATASDDRTIRLWNMSDPEAEPAVLSGHIFGISAVTFSPDGRWLASASDDRTTRLWDMSNLETQPIVLRGHLDSVRAVAFSPDGQRLITASADRTARLWDISNLEAEPVILRGHEDSVLAAAFSPDGQRVATTSADRTARLWTVAESAVESVILRGHEGSVWAAIFSPDGRWLATGSADDSARLWDVNNPLAEPAILRGHENPVNAVTFSPDGHWLATTSDDLTVRLWNISPRLNTGVNDLAAEPEILRGHQAEVRAVAFSPDGQRLATGSDDRTIRLWNVSALLNTSGQAVATEPLILRGHDLFVLAVAFSPKGQWLASGSSDTTVRLWNMNDLAAEPVLLPGHESSVLGVAFSPDGRWLASVSADRTTRLWNVSAWLNTGGAVPATEPLILRGHESKVNAVAFSPDGDWLATASDDGTARLWQVNNPAAEPVVLPGREVFVSAVAFSPNGHWLAMASADRIALLWDVSTLLNAGSSELEGVPLRLHGHNNFVSAVTFSPDGRWLATASGDGLIRLWHMNLDELMALGCVTAGRNLDTNEWKQFLPGEVYRRTC